MEGEAPAEPKIRNQAYGSAEASPSTPRSTTCLHLRRPHPHRPEPKHQRRRRLGQTQHVKGNDLAENVHRTPREVTRAEQRRGVIVHLVAETVDEADQGVRLFLAIVLHIEDRR